MFTISNVDNASLLKDISSKKDNENFKIENYPFKSEQEAFDGIIINYLLDAINTIWNYECEEYSKINKYWIK